MTGTALTEATEFMKIYKLGVVQVPTNRPMVREDRNDQVYKTKAASGTRWSRRSRTRNARGSRCSSGTISVEVSELLSEQLRRRGIAAHGPQRQAGVRRARGRDRRRGRPARRGHDRDQHGRPRRRHQARRQPRAPHGLELAKLGLQPGDPDFEERFAAGPARRSRSAWRTAPERRRGGRAVHLRHRAPRVAPDRQPASRPLRPPGRPRRVALLPLGRGRPRAPVRRRPHLQHPRPLRHDRRGGPRGADRGRDALEADREGPDEGRGAELPHPQARARVRRRHERAAADRLRVPRRGARGRGHGRAGARGDRERHAPHRRGAHARRLRRGVGPRRAVHRAGRHLAGRAHRGRRHQREPRPRGARRTGSSARRSTSTTVASRSSARSSCARSSATCCCRSSTSAGASTSTTWTTCARASTCAGSPRSTRSSRTRTRRSGSSPTS